MKPKQKQSDTDINKTNNVSVPSRKSARELLK